MRGGSYLRITEAAENAEIDQHGDTEDTGRFSLDP